MKFIIGIAILIIIAVSLTQAARRSRATERAGAYRRRKLMTDNELEFFGRLVAALPDHYVFPQVAMSALIEAASTDTRKAHGDRLRIAQQRADYVVCNRNCDLIAVVELDDKSHSRQKDQLRDSRLEQGGIRTIRFQSRTKPAVDTIRTAILGPALPGATVTSDLSAVN